MNDFFQSLSFHGAPRPAARLGHAAAPLRCIMRSFDEVPFTAYLLPPALPRVRKSRRPANRKS